MILQRAPGSADSTVDKWQRVHFKGVIVQFLEPWTRQQESLTRPIKYKTHVYLLLFTRRDSANLAQQSSLLVFFVACTLVWGCHLLCSTCVAPNLQKLL